MNYFKKLLFILLSLSVFCSCSVESSDEKKSASYIGTKAPEIAKEVGDIVFNDGSSMAYYDFLALDDSAKESKKAFAIALIFYKGTGLNSDDSEGNVDTVTSRTLGVGLKHDKTGLRWAYALCEDYAQGYEKNISTITCVFNSTDFEFAFTGDKNGSDNLEQVEAFEGVNDTNKPEYYPAFYFGKNYATSTATNISSDSEYTAGWYLPSAAESYQISMCDTINGFDIDAASEDLGGDKFGDSTYWTSSQFNEEYYMKPDILAWEFKIETGFTDVTFKSDYNCFCAIREFN